MGGVAELTLDIDFGSDAEILRAYRSIRGVPFIHFEVQRVSRG